MKLERGAIMLEGTAESFFLKIKKSTIVKASRLLIANGQEHHIFQVFVQPLSNKGTTNPKLWETKIQSYHFSAVVFSTFTRHVY